MPGEVLLDKGVVYLNHAGVAPWPRRTADAVKRFADENAAAGSLHYLRWLGVEQALRQQAGFLLNVQPHAVALLKNTSEALSVVACGLDWKDGDNVVGASQEFPSNRIVWESLSVKGVEYRPVDLASTALPEDALFHAVDCKTRLISVSSIQYATGLRMDLERIGAFCRKRGILFCVDAIQSLGAVRFDAAACSADFVMADGHKWMLGPEGLALFFCRPEVMDRIGLTQFGWHMVEDAGNFDRTDWRMARSARRFECGSPNMLGIHALNASLSLLLETGMSRVEDEVLARSGYLIGRLGSLPGLQLITPGTPGRYGGIITFRLRKGGAEALYRRLEGRGVVCALRGGGIRLSPHFYTPLEEIDGTVEAIKDFL